MRQGLVLGIGVGLLGAAGCASIGSDVSRDPRFPTDYVVGGAYALKNARLVERTGTWPSTGLVVKAPGQLNVPNAPHSVAEYQSTARRWPTVAGVLPAGTKLRVRKLVYLGSLRFTGLDPIAEVYATVLDGTLAGRTVEISWISRAVEQHHPPCRMRWVNLAELKAIDE